MATQVALKLIRNFNQLQVYMPELVYEHQCDFIPADVEGVRQREKALLQYVCEHVSGDLLEAVRNVLTADSPKRSPSES